MSILAISLYFTLGLNFGIDFSGGTLIEVQTKAPQADLAKMRATLNGLGLGEVHLQEFGAPNDVLDPLQGAAGRRRRAAGGASTRRAPRSAAT